MVSRLVEHYVCPITQQMLVDPVVAEDGHTYERSAVEQWLRTHKKSPVTNSPMGSVVVPSLAARNTVCELVEAGALDRKTALGFYVRRGHVRAARTAPPGPDLEGAQADFARARELADDQGVLADQVRLSTEVVSWMEQGMKLFAEVKRAKCADLSEWAMDVGNSLRLAARNQLAHRMAEWQNLPQGAQVRVVDNVDELRTLCERPPPGARAKVGWNDLMAGFAGQICEVKKTGEASHRNYILRRDASGSTFSFSFPYDALELMPPLPRGET